MPLEMLKQLRIIRNEDLFFVFIAITFFLLPTGTAPPLISIGLATILFLLSIKTIGLKTLFQKKWFFPLCLMALLPWIGLLYSKEMELGFDYALKTKYWCVSFITAGLIIDRNRVKRMVQMFWAGLLLGASLALLQLLGIMTPIREGFLGFGVVHTLVSMYIIVGILMASFYFKTGEKVFEKVSMIFVIVMLFFHLTVLEGRNGYFLFALLSPLIANNLMYKFSAITKIGVMLLLILSMAVSPIVQREIRKTDKLFREKNVIIKGEFHPNFDRPFMFHSAVKLFIANPLTGIGTGSFRHYTREKGHPSAHPHNSLLYMAVSFGIVGLIAILWFFYEMFKRGVKNRDHPLGYLVLSICLTVFLGGFLNTPILNTGTLLLLSMGYGLANRLES